jgi:hypothetical protein
VVRNSVLSQILNHKERIDHLQRHERLSVHKFALQQKQKLLLQRRQEIQLELEAIGQEMFEVNAKIKNLEVVIDNPELHLHGNKTYSCPRCSYVTDSKKVFKNHIYSFHSY